MLTLSLLIVGQLSVWVDALLLVTGVNVGDGVSILYHRSGMVILECCEGTLGSCWRVHGSSFA